MRDEDTPFISLTLGCEAATTQLGARLARVLQAGDTLLLAGEIGTGKTHLARAVVQEMLPVPEDVPSPTFTLVQTYTTPNCDIWHADLYRLSDSSELIELGLDDAFGSSVVLIEWPDRLPGELMPESYVSIALNHDGVGRIAEVTFVGSIRRELQEAFGRD